MIRGFRHEAARHLARTQHRYSDDLRDFIATSAALINPSNSAELFLLVPVHALEQCVERYASTLPSWLDSERVNIIVFINGNSRDLAESDFTARVRYLTTLLRDLLPRYRLYTIARYFDLLPGMGLIRAILADVAIVAGLSLAVRRPTLVFQDVDTVAVSSAYCSDVLRFSESRKTKMVVGPVYYGYKDSTLFGISGDVKIPELYLFNKINQAILTAARHGEINFERRAWPEGANMIMPAAAYCAVGGFDHSYQSGEDDAIGRALHRYNPSVYLRGPVTADTAYEADDDLLVHFSEHCWIVTDPRRIIFTINQGKTGMEAWANNGFSQTRGASLTTACLVEEYLDDKNRLQNDSLVAAERSRNLELRSTLVGRIIDLAIRTLKADLRVRNDEQAIAVLRRAGILPTVEVSITRLDVDNLVKQVEWDHCDFIRGLLGSGYVTL